MLSNSREMTEGWMNSVATATPNPPNISHTYASTHTDINMTPVCRYTRVTHLCPNIRVDLVSASLYTDGEQQMMIVVRQFPPRESCRIRVILLSL